MLIKRYHFFQILVRVGYLIYLPFYVQQMSKEYQVPLIAQHICSVTSRTTKVSSSDIDIFLSSSQMSGIDPLEIGVGVIENLRARDEEFSPENLEWISLAYNYVEDPKLVMLALLRAVIHIARSSFQAGRIDKLKSYFKVVSVGRLVKSVCQLLFLILLFFNGVCPRFVQIALKRYQQFQSFTKQLT